MPGARPAFDRSSSARSRASKLSGFLSLALVALMIAQFAPGSGAASATAAHTVERVTVESFDGTDLGGWLVKPAGVAGKLPAILISTPYIGQCVTGMDHEGQRPCWPTPETPEDWAKHPEPVEKLVEWGYAVGWFSVRGTGVSGGCWEDLGANEQRDQKVLVEWLAAQPWSNGKVGAMGISYMSQTALAAAVERPEALKTIVVGGVLGDLYTFFHSPQGLLQTATVSFANEASYGLDISLTPPGLAAGDAELAASRAPQHYQRACPELARVFSEGSKGGATGIRDSRFWLERRLTDRYDEIEASVFVAQGFEDLFQSGHKMQEDEMWSQIRSPKAMLLGQWGHTYPWMSGFSQVPQRPELKKMWFETLRSWLDHYLMDGPRPDIAGLVRYEDDSGIWHESKSWPPKEARDEALYLGPAGALSGTTPTAESSATFRSYPQLERTTTQEAFLCPALLDPSGQQGSLVFATEPVTERTVIAGNPMAYLDVVSDQEGGGFQVTLYDLGPRFNCSGGLSGRSAQDARALTLGGADLRFHRGNFVPQPFTDGHVRVDIANLAAVLEPGHRLGMTVSYGDPAEFVEIGHSPLIGVRSGPRVDASQLVIPVVKGGFGGSKPRTEFPPRP